MPLKGTSLDRAAAQAEVKASRQSLRNFVGAVRSGKKLGITGKRFKHVVNIGIGGSDLGPLLVCEALHHEWSGDLTPHFVSNVDRTQLEDLTRTIDPAEVLVIVCSKTFVTQETQANANAARAWIVGALGEKSPANREYKLEVATYYNNLALALGSQRMFGVAKNPNHLALDLVEELAAPSPAISLERGKILKLHDWIALHEADAGTAAAPDHHPEFHGVYLVLARGYGQIARDYLDAGNTPEAVQAIASMRALLPKLTASEQAQIGATYRQLQKELDDKAAKHR